VLAARRRHRLNLLASLLFSQGTPMLLAGDEFGQSQQGNNNAYAQDNEIGWIDWSGLDDDPDFATEVRELIHLRRELPLLRLASYVDGSEMDSSHWSGPTSFKVLFAESLMDADRSRVAILINNGDEDVEFRLPGGNVVQEWRVAWSADDIAVSDDGQFFTAAPHSISLLVQWGRTTATL
jgi:pullulanase/glycogen debranching enzyme